MTIVARSADIIADSFRSYLAPGSAMDGPNVRALLRAYAGSQALLEDDFAALQNEIAPETANVLLADYAALLGPDPFGRDTKGLDDAALRRLLQARWTASGGARPADLEQIAAAYGVRMTVVESEPAVCGTATCGAAICSRQTLRFYWVCDLSEDSADVRLQIRAVAPADTIVVFRVNGRWIS